MRPAVILLVLLSAFSGLDSPATAQEIVAFTAGNLRDACDNLVLAVRGVSPISQEDPGAMLCLGYLAGWMQAMQRVPDKDYCLPPPEESLPGDLADLIVTYLDGHPDRISAPAHAVVEETFVDAFPCPTDETEAENDEKP